MPAFAIESGSAPSNTPCGQRYLQKNGSPIPSWFVTNIGSRITKTKRIPYLINRSGFNFRVDIFLNGILCKSSWNHPNGHKKPHTNRPSRTPARIRNLPARGATKGGCLPVRHACPFQSTLPARGATGSANNDARNIEFQSTLPARGATISVEREGRRENNFNPRSPHGERQRKVTILSIRIIGFAQKVYHKTVLLRISLAENAVILPKRPQNPVRTSLQKAGGLRFARAIRAARPYSISSPSGA